MKYSLKSISALALLFLAGGCQTEEAAENKEGNNQNIKMETNDSVAGEEENEQRLEIADIDETNKSVVPFIELLEKVDGEIEFDPVNKTVHAEVEDRNFYMVEDVPVLEINGRYQPYDDVQLFFENDVPYVSVNFLKRGLEVEVEEKNRHAVFSWNGPDWEKIENEVNIFEKSPEEMVDFLSFLDRPIEGASVSTVESHLPGAPRDYRNGEHEGIDYYDYSSGVEITTDTPVYGMAEGTVVRVDHDFEDYESHDDRNAELARAAEVGFTPEDILDRLRGMQVWIQYSDGVMIRFAHLDSIPQELQLGDKIDEETIIGFVGNTGTSGALDEDGSGLHLHKDLLVNGNYFWEPYTLSETAEILHDLWP